ncbi:MAG TPA: SAM-dependent methyltransferase [Ktedonobacteraceae bacterium]|nr:SAM-dependent methyltransferase [Ktedonobacteraceae bacterium]
MNQQTSLSGNNKQQAAPPVPTLIVTAHPEFLDAALDELKQLQKRLMLDEVLAPGIALCSVPNAAELLHRAAQQHLIFVRHLAPVQASVKLTNSEQDIGALALAIAALPTFSLLERGQRFAVQTRFVETSRGGGLPRPRDPLDDGAMDTRAGQARAPTDKRPYSSGRLNQSLAEAISEETGAVESIKKPQIVISILCTTEKAYIGISPASDNLSPWPGGMRHFAQTSEQISRAEFKLLEALEVFGLSLPSRGHALDLGAAPGGWTRLLLEAGLSVVAVDPAKLDPRLLISPLSQHLEHYRGYAEGYLEEAIKKHRLFDVIANDMRMDAREASRLLVQAGKCLRRDGFIISTLKLPHATPTIDPMKNLKEALHLLGRQFNIVQAHQLFHNRQEVTVVTAQPRVTRS